MKKTILFFALFSNLLCTSFAQEIIEESKATKDFVTTCTKDQYVFVNDSEKLEGAKNITFKDYDCIQKTDHEVLKTALYNQITDETKNFDVDINNREILSQTLLKETQLIGKNQIDIKALAALGSLPTFKQIVRNYFISLLKP